MPLPREIKKTQCSNKKTSATLSGIKHNNINKTLFFKKATTSWITTFFMSCYFTDVFAHLLIIAAAFNSRVRI